MGVSADGLLAFGFPLGDEDEEGERPAFLGDCEDLDDYIAEKAGLADAPYEQRKALVEACPAEIVDYCSYSYTMSLLAVRGTCLRADQGHTVEVTADHLAVDPAKVAAFRDWCAAHGIAYTEPKWLLCSHMG